MRLPRCRRAALLRAGHTLVEILLALGLSLLLLAAAYTAFDTHYRYTSVGQLETEQQQVARSLMMRIGRDFRNADFRAGTGLPTSSDASPTACLTGDAEAIRLYIRDAASRPTMEADPESERASSARRLEIAWETAAPGTGDRGTKGRPPRGLSRRVRPAEAARRPFARPDAFQTDVAAPEVRAFRFRYHDGTAWRSTWNSVETGRLPRAVEVVIRFESPESASGLRSTRSSAEYRQVFYIPASETAGPGRSKSSALNGPSL